MVQARVFTIARVVAEEREVGHPQEAECLLVDQLQLAAHLQAQDAHGHGDGIGGVGGHEDGVVTLGAESRQEAAGHGFTRPLLAEVRHRVIAGLQDEQVPLGRARIRHDPSLPEFLVDLAEACAG